MPLVKQSHENLVRVDGKRRVVLPKGLSLAQYYAVEVTEEDEIILHPRVVVDPREVISKKSLVMLDESMRNYQQGKVGKPVDLSDFETHGAGSDGRKERKQKKRNKTS